MWRALLVALREALTRDYKTLLHIEACVAELAVLPQYSLSASTRQSTLETSLLGAQYTPSAGGSTSHLRSDSSSSALKSAQAEQGGTAVPAKRLYDAASSASISSGDGDGDLEIDGEGELDVRAEAEWELFETRKDHLRQALHWARAVSLGLCKKRRQHDLDFELEMDMAEANGAYTFSATGEAAQRCALSQAESKRAMRDFIAGRRAGAATASVQHKYDEIGTDDIGEDGHGHEVKVVDGVRSSASHSRRHGHDEGAEGIMGWLVRNTGDSESANARAYKLGPARLMSFPRTHGRILVLLAALWGRERWEADYGHEEHTDKEEINAKKALLEEELRRKFASDSGGFIDVLREVSLRDLSDKYIEPLCSLILEGRLDKMAFLWHYPGAAVPYDPMRLLLSFTDFMIYKEFYEACEEHEWNSYTAVLVDSVAYWPRALLAFVFQALMYYGALFSDEPRTSGGDWFTLVSSLIIILFTYLYAMMASVSEMYAHTFWFLIRRKSWVERMALVFHVLDNCVLVLLLTVITARLLRTSDEFMDVAINSVVLYFIADIDKLAVSSFDQRYLSSRIARGAIRTLRETAESNSPCSLAEQYAKCYAKKRADHNEQHSARVAARYSIPVEWHISADAWTGFLLVILANVGLVWAGVVYWELSL